MGSNSRMTKRLQLPSYPSYRVCSWNRKPPHCRTTRDTAGFVFGDFDVCDNLRMLCGDTPHLGDLREEYDSLGLVRARRMRDRKLPEVQEPLWCQLQELRQRDKDAAAFGGEDVAVLLIQRTLFPGTAEAAACATRRSVWATVLLSSRPSARTGR